MVGGGGGGWETVRGDGRYGGVSRKGERESEGNYFVWRRRINGGKCARVAAGAGDDEVVGIVQRCRGGARRRHRAFPIYTACKTVRGVGRWWR